MVNGVSQVNVFGAQKYAVHVQVDPNKLKAQDLGINEVDQALQNWNVNSPTGQLFGAHVDLHDQRERPAAELRKGCCDSAEVFRPIVVTYKDGRPVRLEQVADVVDSVETPTQRAWLYTKAGTHASITCAIQKQPGHERHRSHRRGPRALLPSLMAQLPRSVHSSVRSSIARRRSASPSGRAGDDAHHAGACRGCHLSLPAQRVGHADSRRSRCRFRFSARSP